MAPNAATRQGSWVLERAMNDGQVGNDTTVIRSHVRDKLFEKSVVVWTKSALVKSRALYKDCVKSCKSLVADGRLMTVNNDEAEAHMSVLWGKVEKSHLRWMGKKRSATRQATQDGFMSEYSRLLACS